MNLSPVKAIRAWCLECEGGSPKAVRLCSNDKCHLYLYRMGRNPRRKGIGGRNPGSFKKT